MLPRSLRRTSLPLSLSLLFLPSCSSPTSPDTWTLKFTGVSVSSEDQAWAHEEFLTQANCVKPNRTLSGELEIRTMNGPFYCGGILVNGCQMPGQLQVIVQVWRPALSHELIHHFEMLDGHAPDFNHTSPVWKQCDRLNWGGGN